MSVQPSRAPPTWGEWKERHQRWAWVLSPEWASEWIVHWSRDWDIVNALDLAAGSWWPSSFSTLLRPVTARRRNATGLGTSSTPHAGRRGMAGAALRSRASTRTRYPWPQLYGRADPV